MYKEPITKEGLQKLKEELDNLKNIENQPSKTQIQESPIFGQIQDFLTRRKMLSGLKIVYKGRFVKSEFTFADPILKK